MASLDNKIVPHLWFDNQARQAAEFYTTVFEDSRIRSVGTLTDTPSGMVEIVSFDLFSQEFRAISAGPLFKFNESISFIVKCDTQVEIDAYWDALASDGGEPGQCGWLTDRYGLSWQIVPAIMDNWMGSNDREAVSRVTAALLKMKKLEIAALKAAFGGEGR